VPATRTYKSKDIIVYWYPELCIHARHCVNILPGVFRPKERPWVDLDGATPLEVILAVDKCPAGALRYSLPEGSCVHPAAADGPGFQREETGAAPENTPGPSPAGPVKITVAADGPLLTEGPLKLVDQQGRTIAEAGRLALCRCGLSAKMPFCDGTHSKKGWKG